MTLDTDKPQELVCHQRKTTNGIHTSTKISLNSTVYGAHIYTYPVTPFAQQKAQN